MSKIVLVLGSQRDEMFLKHAILFDILSFGV